MPFRSEIYALIHSSTLNRFGGANQNRVHESNDSFQPRFERKIYFHSETWFENHLQLGLKVCCEAKILYGKTGNKNLIFICT